MTVNPRLYRGNSKGLIFKMVKWILGNGENFRARGFFVPTVGLDEEMVRNYIRDQGRGEKRYEPVILWKN